MIQRRWLIGIFLAPWLAAAGPAQQEQSAAGAWQLAQELVESGEQEAALSACDEQLQRHPDSLEGLLLRARLQLELAQYEAADEGLRRCAELAPNAYEPIFLQGLLAWKRGDEEAAYVQMLRCRELRPGDGAVHNLIGLLEQRAGYLRRAEESFQRAAEHWSESPAPAVNLARLKLRAGHPAASLEQLQSVTEAFGPLPEVDFALSKVYLRMGCHRAALASIREVLQQEGEGFDSYRIEAFCRLGRHFDELGRDVEAITCFEAALLQAESTLPIFADVGRLYLADGRSEDAARMLGLAVRLEDSTDHRLLLARALEADGRPEEARGELRELYDRGARRPELLGALARVEEHCGSPERAQAAFDELLQAGIDHPQLTSSPGYLLAMAERSLQSQLPGIASPQRGQQAWQRLRSSATRLDSGLALLADAAAMVGFQPPELVSTGTPEE